MTKLSIDIETYSGYDLSDVGVYKYTEHPDFEILLLAYAFDDEPVQVVDLASGEQLPERVYQAMFCSTDVELHAHNAAFERVCINAFFLANIQPERWHCTMIHSAMLGLPLALGAVAKVLKLSDQKDAEGKALIKYFCMPCKPTAKNGMRTRNLPADDLEKWAKFIEYCRQDVVVEREIRKKTDWYVIPAFERELWCLDQRINDRGVLLDITFVENAIRVDSDYRDRLDVEARELTGLENPNSRDQLIGWLESQGVSTETLRKDDVTNLLDGDYPEHVNRVLTIRQEMAKTSNKKYHAMLAGVCADGRFRGLFQFYGANRTGRWAGRLVQVQNLPKNKIEGSDLDLARSLVSEGDGETLENYYGNVPDTLSQLIRTAFIAPEGHRLVVCDAAAIEARIIAWLANERWRLEVFSTHGKIYEASAAQMFKVDIDTIKKGMPNYALRQKGKIAELALGYGGGVNALETMGALKMGLREDELQPLVNAWRNANPAITLFWKAIESAAITAVKTGERQRVKPGIEFFCKNSVLFVQLPSGRCLSYMRPKIKPSRFGGDSLAYEGMNQTTKQWMGEDTYGGKLVENITQAIARDCLAHSLTNIAKAGYPIVLHVHDEVVSDVAVSVGSLDEVEKIMSEPIPWAKGLPLGADGFESSYYHK